jgi:hypothetical protein
MMKIGGCKHEGGSEASSVCFMAVLPFTSFVELACEQMLGRPLLIAKPLFLDSSVGMIGFSGERMRDIGDKLSPFLGCHREENLQKLCDARGVGFYDLTLLLRSLHEAFALLTRRRSVASDEASDISRWHRLMSPLDRRSTGAGTAL